MAGRRRGPLGGGCLSPQASAVGERIVTELRMNALNTDSRPTPPSKRNAQNLPLKATGACAGKPGRGVSARAAVGRDLGVMVFGRVPSAHKCRRVSGGMCLVLCFPLFHRLWNAWGKGMQLLFVFFLYFLNSIAMLWFVFFKKKQPSAFPHTVIWEEYKHLLRCVWDQRDAYRWVDSGGREERRTIFPGITFKNPRKTKINQNPPPI